MCSDSHVSLQHLFQDLVAGTQLKRVRRPGHYYRTWQIARPTSLILRISSQRPLYLALLWCTSGYATISIYGKIMKTSSLCLQSRQTFYSSKIQRWLMWTRFVFYFSASPNLTQLRSLVIMEDDSQDGISVWNIYCHGMQHFYRMIAAWLILRLWELFNRSKLSKVKFSQLFWKFIGNVCRLINYVKLSSAIIHLTLLKVKGLLLKSLNTWTSRVTRSFPTKKKYKVTWRRLKDSNSPPFWIWSTAGGR